MMKRHTCILDLGTGSLKFRIGPGEYLETPFLHEKDLDEDKGGTKGFDATAANQKILEMEMKDAADSGKQDEKKKKDDGDGDGDTSMSS